MIGAAWLFAAIELNGALISRGANTHLDAQQCAVESRAMAPVIAPQRFKEGLRGTTWVTQAGHCHFDETEQVLRIRLPQQALATQTLTLGESGGSMSIALLHQPQALAQSADYAAQPPTRSIASLAIDAAAGSGLNSLGAIWSNGPWSLQALHQQPHGGPAARRATADYFFSSGAHIRAGDFRTDHGPEQRFGEFRGLILTNRAAPLRGDGKAEADLAIQSPSRVQFFDRNGIAVYSSEILPPGNYRVQGFGASTVPGFLEARVVDINGVTQSIALPWSADRKLLSYQQTEWEVFRGEPRMISGSLTPPPLNAARLRYGLAQHNTVGLHAERLGSTTRVAMELNSRAIANTIATAAIGQSCILACTPTWLAEARMMVGSRMHATVSTARTESLTDPGMQHITQLSLSGSLHPRVSGSLQLSSQRRAEVGTQQAATVSATLRLDHSASLVMQARHHVLPDDGARWSGFVGFTMHFGQHQASVASYATVQGPQAAQPARYGATVQATLGGGRMYGPQFSVAHSQDGLRRSDGFLRYATPMGDASLRADSLSQRITWSAATRLWITGETITLSPAGEDNLVIQKLGLANVRIAHSGRDSQVTNTQGTAVFRKAPPWTDTVYTVDAKSIPFGTQLASSRVRIPLASNRAYLVDFQGLWSQLQSWRLSAAALSELSDPAMARDRFGKTIFITADGFVDMASADQLPLIITTAGRTMRCALAASQAPVSATSRETTLQCHPNPNL